MKAGLFCRVMHSAHHVGERSERYLHLTYFAGISTGIVDYHLAAAGCLVAGLLLFLPAAMEVA